MVKRFSKRVRDELHVACTNCLVSSRSGLWSFPDGKCWKASSAQLLSHWNVCGQPAQLGVGLISNVIVKLKRNGKLLLVPCLCLFPYFCRSFSHLGVISEVSRLSSCRFFKSCKLCVLSYK